MDKDSNGIGKTGVLKGILSGFYKIKSYRR